MHDTWWVCILYSMGNNCWTVILEQSPLGSMDFEGKDSFWEPLSQLLPQFPFLVYLYRTLYAYSRAGKNWNLVALMKWQWAVHFSFQLLPIKYYLPNEREMFSPYQLTRPLCLHDFTSPLEHQTSFFTWPGHNSFALGNRTRCFFPALLGSGVRSSSAAYVTHFSFSSLVRSSCACSNSCLSWICASCWSAISERMVCNFTNSCKTDLRLTS